MEFLFHCRSGKGQLSVRPLAQMHEAFEHPQKPATLRQHLLSGARWMQERRAMTVEQWHVRRISAQSSGRHCHLNQGLRALSDVAKRVAVRLWCLFFAFSPICRWPFLASL